MIDKTINRQHSIDKTIYRQDHDKTMNGQDNSIDRILDRQTINRQNNLINRQEIDSIRHLIDTPGRTINRHDLYRQT